uniref:Uncharacterized protein n=1 Tax=viral metagenome TaxID=1070528 RepID=A0A6C0BEP2_9ZZZZ
MDFASIYKKLDIERIPRNEIYDNQTAICISGSYRTFDFCKNIIKENILNYLSNYSIFVLLSDENEVDIDEKLNNIKDFFGSKLLYLGRTSEFSNNIKEYEKREYQKFKTFTESQNVCFNTRAQFRRYQLNNIKNKYGYFEYTMILRFDIFYTEPVFFKEELIMHNDTYFLGKTTDINILMNEIGLRYNDYVSSSDISLDIFMRVTPEFVYNLIIEKFKIKTIGRYFALCVRNNITAYNTNLYEPIQINDVFVIRPKFSALPYDFDAENYKKWNPDLRFMTRFEAMNHYIYIGFTEGRRYNE